MNFLPLEPFNDTHFGFSAYPTGKTPHLFEALRSLQQILQKADPISSSCSEADNEKQSPCVNIEEDYGDKYKQLLEEVENRLAASRKGHDEMVKAFLLEQEALKAESSRVRLSLAELKRAQQQRAADPFESVSLEALVLKCGLLHEKLLPGENPGEAFWVNEGLDEKEFYELEDVLAVTEAWNSGIREMVTTGSRLHSANLRIVTEGQWYLED